MYRLLVLAIVFIISGCGNSDDSNPAVQATDSSIRAIDGSMIPQVRLSGLVMKNAAGIPEDMLTTLKGSGVNTVRLKVWHNPAEPYAALQQVKDFAAEIKGRGMKVWLTVHYSDTWADPGQQTKPSAWQGQDYGQLKQSVYNYTKEVVQQIRPDYIQVGNEINGGFLWPEGSYQNMEQFKGLLAEGIRAVRETSPDTQIMLHYAGHEWATSFFTNFTTLDYDIIGLSYYPIWHGKNIADLQAAITALKNTFGKKVVIAETSYPFTLEWNDNTHNIIGSTDQLIPAFAPTPQGQKAFMERIVQVVQASGAAGYCYWGGESVAFNGPEATNGSSYENQALWDFNNTALPAQEAFRQ